MSRNRALTNISTTLTAAQAQRSYNWLRAQFGLGALPPLTVRESALGWQLEYDRQKHQCPEMNEDDWRHWLAAHFETDLEFTDITED